MRTTTLGQLTVSAQGLGCMGMSEWYGATDWDESIATIHRALDLGVTFIDTADIYGAGHNEVLVGRGIAGRRDEVQLATKFGIDRSGGDAHRIIRGEHDYVKRACESSLTRLGVDHIDLYQLHWPAPQPIAETAAACAALLKAGKIRAVGVSNFSVPQLEEWRATGEPLHTDQPPYSILRPAVKHDVIPWCAAHNVGVISYSPLFRGLLFGTWHKDKTFAPDDGRSTHKDYSGARFHRHLQAIDEIRAVATDGGLSVPQLCVGVLLNTPGLTAVIAGARNGRQGGLIPNLGVSVTPDQASAVWAIAGRLAKDLEA